MKDSELEHNMNKEIQRFEKRCKKDKERRILSKTRLI